MKIILIIGAIIIVIGTVVFFMVPANKSDQMTPESNLEETVQNSNDAEEAAPVVAIFKDGTYEAEAVYEDSLGEEHNIKASLSLEADMVTTSTVLFDSLPEGEFSEPEQESFFNSYTSEVIGQPLNVIELTVVGGVTLPTEAFTEALEQIKADAKI